MTIDMSTRWGVVARERDRVQGNLIVLALALFYWRAPGEPGNWAFAAILDEDDEEGRRDSNALAW